MESLNYSDLARGSQPLAGHGFCFTQACAAEGRGAAVRARVQIQESPAPLFSVLQDLFASLCKFLFVSFRKLAPSAGAARWI